MLVSNISIDNDAQLLKIPRKKFHVVNAPGAHILLGFNDAWSFDTTRINNHSVTSPS